MNSKFTKKNNNLILRVENPNKIFAFKKTNGGFENAGEKLEMTTFLVGTLHDSDSLNRADEKFNPLELLKNSR